MNAVLLGILGLGLLSSLVFASRPLVPITLAILMRIMIPSYVSNAVMPGLHMAGYVVVATFIVQSIFYWPRVKRILYRSKFEITILVLFSILTMLSRVTGNGSLVGVSMNLAIIYFAPFMLYLLIKMEIVRQGVRAIRFIAYAIHMFMMYEFWLAIQQNEQGEVLYLSEYRVGATWAANSTEIGRSMGTLESGLEFTALCAIAIALVYWVRNSFLRIVLVLMYLYAAILGTGRASIAVGLVTAVLVIMFSRSLIVTKILGFIVGALGVAFLFSTEAGQSLVSKINDDDGSTAKRMEALEWVSNNYHLFIYSGYPGNRDLRSSGELSSSLENAYLTVGMQNGLLVMTILLILQLGIIVKHIKSLAGFVAALAPVGIILTNMTNTGFTTNSASAYMIWVALAFTSVGIIGTASQSQHGEFAGSKNLDVSTNR